MASAHDRTVLQAIFNPTSPFGDIPGLNQEDELTDDGTMKIHNWNYICKVCVSIDSLNLIL